MSSRNNTHGCWEYLSPFIPQNQYAYSGESKEGARGAPAPPLFWVKEKRIVEGRKAGKAEATKKPGTSLP